MFRTSVLQAVVVVVALSLALFSENSALVLAHPAPVIKKDAAIFDPTPGLFDHFDLSRYTQDNKQSQIQPSISIDPLHHEESSPKIVRSIHSGNGNTVANNNAVTPTPAGTALLQALTAIQTAADNSGVHLNSDPNSDQSSVADVQTQIKKLKEQVELYQMINDMLKAETMVQKEPLAPIVSSTPASTTISTHGASLSKPVDVEVTTQTPQAQPKKTRQRQNAPQKQVVPIIPPTVNDGHGQSDRNQDHHGHEQNSHRDYGRENYYHNYPAYDDHDHQENEHPQNHDHVDYDQHNNHHGQHNLRSQQRPQQPHYDDYDHPQENFRPIQHPQVTQPPQIRSRQAQNRGQRKFKRNE